MLRFGLFPIRLLLTIALSSSMIPVAVAEAAIAQTATLSQSTTILSNTQLDRLLVEAKQQYQRMEFRQAISTYQQILVLAKKEKNQTAEIEASIQLSEIYRWINRGNQRSQFLRRALRLARLSGNRQLEGRALALRGLLYLDREEYKKSLIDLELALKLNQQNNDQQGKIQTLQIFGVLYQQQEDYARSRTLLKEALELANNINVNQAVFIQISIASNYIEQKRFEEANILLAQQQLSQKNHNFLAEYSRLQLIADLRYKQGQQQLSLHVYQQAERLAQAVKNPWLQVGAILKAANLVKSEQKLSFYRRALLIANDSDDELVGTIFTEIAMAYRGITNNLSSLIAKSEAYQDLLKAYRKINNRKKTKKILSELGWTYKNLALLHEGRKRTEFILQFESAYQEVIQINDEFNDESDNECSCDTEPLEELGKAYRELKQYSKAKSIYESVLTVTNEHNIKHSKRKTSMNGIDLEVEALMNLSAIYYFLGNPEQEKLFYQSAVDLQDKMQDSKYVCIECRLPGIYGEVRGNEVKKLFYWKLALDKFRKKSEHKYELEALREIGGIYMHIGPYSKAAESYQAMIDLFKFHKIDSSHHISTHPYYSLKDIGLAYFTQANYSEALKYYQMAISLAKHDFQRSEILINFGDVYQKLGLSKKAIESYLQADHTIRSKKDELDKLSEDLITDKEVTHNLLNSNNPEILQRLGVVYQLLNKPDISIKLYERALLLLGDNDILWMLDEKAPILDDLAIAYRTLGQSDRAIKLHKEALRIFDTLLIPAGQARTLSNLGDAYRVQGNLGQAHYYYQQSISIQKRMENVEGEARNWSNLASLYAQSQPELAISFYKKSVSIYEDIRKSLAPLAKDQRESYTKTIAQTYRDLADLLLKNDRILEAQQVLDLLKLQELDEYIRNVRGGNQTITFRKAETELLEKFDLAQKSIIDLFQRIGKLRKMNRTNVEEAELTKLATLEGQMNTQINQFFEQADVKQILQQLRIENTDPNPKYLERLQLTSQENLKQSAILYPLILPDRLELVLFITGAPPLRRTISLPKSELNSSIQSFLSALRDPAIDPRPEAQKLYRWLIQPLEADLKRAQVKTIIYAPDSQLRYIPLAALHDGQQWLTERYQFNNITAISLATLSSNFRPSANSLKVLAGSISGDKQTKYSIEVGQQRHDFSGLPSAKEEVENIATVIPNTNKYIDQQFDLTTLKNDFEKYQVLHFATHGYFDLSSKEQSFLLFGGKTAEGQPQIATLRDIETWSLRGIDLVVLSACETGISERLSRSRFGEGIEVLGLGYLFQARGARATISSLWRVDDAGTQVLMSAFYKELSQGNISTIAALQKAQIALIHSDQPALTQLNRGRFINLSQVTPVETKGTSRPIWNNPEKPLSHPYYWAPFILIGNGL
jgi:CHAT domain-containing protein